MNLKEFIHTHSFATLITQVGTIHISHLNLIMDEINELYLYGHLALSNPQPLDFEGNPKALAVFSRDTHQPKEENEFAYFVHGDIEIIHDQEQKKRIFDQLVAQYENHSATGWVIDWQDSRYLQMMNSVVFFAIKINTVEVQIGSELNETTILQENSLYLACAKLSDNEPRSEQDMVYIPRHFYEGKQEYLLEFIKHQNISLVLLCKQDEFFARYVNLGEEESIKPLLAAAKQKANEETKALMLLKGPHCYISPRFYQTKFNVPTWNYTMLYVEGMIRAQQFEPYRMFGKFKLSQNRNAEDKASVCTHLSASTDEMDRNTASCMHRTGIKI